ncbi:protein-serine O-palmitoleoyltransferase porcupine [Odontomachus brunneus]|uniref:protein-serine O-palmitoleoyltransferase porcupine n=1 Tax=Odontomachus brunneus TaxID=486640 RepID=UPI0013F1B12F|nr:protein-serine O-palmitoleoyltransferase porcupine [Odontomachus brunneus]XP_032678731.1 protein-serine O-palmitoleoyltransferase porcupine [Odontomachus brunneus]XP_032678732.1 protein-serine O-palmitoleoyltransferase porcupine [Odontomachus brunneus]
MEDVGATVFYDDEDDCLDYDCMQNVEYDFDYVDAEKENLYELYEYCLSPTLYDTGRYMLPLLGSTVLFRLFVYTPYISHRIFHILSVIIGLCVIQYYMQECLIILIVFVLFSYGILYIPKKWHGGIGIFLPSLLIIAYCEFSMQSVIWHKVRSVIMTMAMKVISIAIDTSDSNDLPDIYSYTSYVFCGVTCLFGPWISFRDYISLRTSNSQTKLCIIYGIGYIFLAFIFLSISNCWTQWIFVNNSWKWLIAYRDALSFRSSHYFVSYIASALLILAGFPLPLSTTVQPLYIEFPRSLVQVVIYWNIPMHYWLKTYIFRPSIKRFGKFGAVTVTYLISALLHGLNFQLAAVLLSLGFYTYIEFKLRIMLADIFNACIASKQCASQKCTHKYTSYNCLWVFMINMAFSGLSMFHLAYLGLMFDTSDLQETGYSYSHTIDKWAQLGFASHWVALATYCIYFLIK